MSKRRHQTLQAFFLFRWFDLNEMVQQCGNRSNVLWPGICTCIPLCNWASLSSNASSEVRPSLAQVRSKSLKSRPSFLAENSGLKKNPKFLLHFAKHVVWFLYGSTSTRINQKVSKSWKFEKNSLRLTQNAEGQGKIKREVKVREEPLNKVMATSQTKLL